ncbi:hypothetical protein CDL12_26478 [Handroanthus impetiginosus]|uniref:Uncharacterized protein n=1 Tax=Handroanthus impetiginosus TaxID=429701 RepID=A0A2G9G6S6_9LAMI|nr:hypothetical protein CDL12_26478 [Handroanthus impetiginosus]
MSCSCSWSSSKTLITIISITFLGFLLLNSCTAVRPGKMMKMMEENDVSAIALKYFEEKEKLPNDALYFTKLPKGVPIPPSAPSPRHNSSPQD